MFDSGVAEWIYLGKGKIFRVWKNRHIRDGDWYAALF